MPATPSVLRGIRATRAIVDLDAIAGNLQALRTILPDSTKIMAVVKADGYGHGAPWVARTALSGGATSLGVATVSEGASLRSHGIDSPIVLLGSIDPAEALAACASALEIAIADDVLLEAVQRAARSSGAQSPVAVHLKIDTGLRRYGTMPEMAPALATRIVGDPHLRFAGIFTHFASADEPDDAFTNDQLQRFERALETIHDAGVPLPALHAANSAGMLTGRGTRFDIVRPGIALYGVPPSAGVSLLPGMRAALRVESRITRLVQISPGDTVGYNRTFQARSPIQGALIPIGYADGYRRSLAGLAWLGIGGQPAPVLGRISMDQIVAQVPAGAEAKAGDVVHVFGGDPAFGAPSIQETAALMGTNCYEVLVGLRQRVPRVYMRGGEHVAVRSAGDSPTPDD